MSTPVTQDDIARALRYYLRDYAPVRDSYALPKEASVLGDALGLMIYNQSEDMPWCNLSVEQQTLLRVVFDEESGLPLV
jgi:hypothetical protein